MKKSAFTLIELLIVITIIGILTALAANFLGQQAGAKSRDTIRMSNINQIGTVISSLQNRFHTPPLIDSNLGKKYPNDCGGDSSLKNCFKTLKVSSDEGIKIMFTDPKQGVKIGNKTFQYYYGATANGFKVCTHLEDQGAFEKLNADEEGRITEKLDSSNESAYMYCIINGSDVDEITVKPIEIGE